MLHISDLRRATVHRIEPSHHDELVTGSRRAVGDALGLLCGGVLIGLRGALKPLRSFSVSAGDLLSDVIVEEAASFGFASNLDSTAKASAASTALVHLKSVEKYLGEVLRLLKAARQK